MSMSFNCHDSFSCVSADSFRTTAFLFSETLQHCSQNLGSPSEALSVQIDPELSGVPAILSLRQIQLSQSSLGLLPDCFALSQPFSTVSKTHSVRTAVQLSYSSCLVYIKCSLPFHVCLPFNKHQARGDPPSCGITHTYAPIRKQFVSPPLQHRSLLSCLSTTAIQKTFRKFLKISFRAACVICMLILLPFPPLTESSCTVPAFSCTLPAWSRMPPTNTSLNLLDYFASPMKRLFHTEICVISALDGIFIHSACFQRLSSRFQEHFVVFS